MVQIVVIEDNVQNARMAAKLLRRAGYDVLVAEDGEMGLTTVFENTPDLILIDLGLPDIDGQTVIGLVRQHEALKKLPIIAFTAWPPDEAHDMATRYGCDGVITKPINTRTFADQIGAFLPKEESSETEESETSTDDGLTDEAKSQDTADTSNTGEDIAKSPDVGDIETEASSKPAISTKPETVRETSSDNISSTADEIASEASIVPSPKIDEPVSTKSEIISESSKNDVENTPTSDES